MLSLSWKARGLVCRGIASSQCLMETSSVLSLLVSLVILAILMTKSAWALCAFDMSDPWLCGSTVCGHLSKRRLTNRDAAYVASDSILVDSSKSFLPEPPSWWVVFCFYLGLADLLLPVSHLVCILTHCCSFDRPISSSDFWESFTDRKLQYKQ